MGGAGRSCCNDAGAGRRGSVESILAGLAVARVVRSALTRRATRDRYLVLGACGFAGSHLVDLLVAQGEEVVAADLPGTDTSYVDRAGVPFVPVDLTRPETLEALWASGPFAGVYHFAELSSFSVPMAPLLKVNQEGTRNLLQALRDKDTGPLVVLGSGGVYGAAQESPVDEQTPHRPLTPYDLSKSRMEHEVDRAAQEWGLSARVVRPAAVYGPRSRKGAAVPLFLMALGQMPAIPGRGDGYAAFTHVRDVVGAAHHLMQRGPAGCEAYNVADDTLMTIRDILFTLAPHVDARMYNVQLPHWGLRLLSWYNERKALKTGRPARIERDAFALLMHDTFMSNRKLKETGYELVYPDFILGMVETIQWYKANNWLWRGPGLGDQELPGAPP